MTKRWRRCCCRWGRPCAWRSCTWWARCERMTLVVILTVRAGAAAAFRAYEQAAAAIMARHGGAIDRVVVIPPDADDAGGLPREVHLVRFPSAQAPADYRNEPALAALAPDRAHAVASTEIPGGEQARPHDTPST